MKITIIEDNIQLAENIAKKIKTNWYNVSIFNELSSFKTLSKQGSDMYIIDLNLSKWDEGFEIIRWLREDKKSIKPILIMSGYSDSERKVYWLDIGADDYITKPIDSEELLARIRALLRRDKSNKSYLIKYKDFIFDTKNKNLINWVDENIHFTKKEKALIEFFILNKSTTITKNEITSTIWWDYDWLWVTDNTVNVTVHNLRKKLWDKFNLHTIVWEWYILKD